MLTLKSRMFSADRLGTEVTDEDLKSLKQLLTCDYRNFRGKENKISFGFTSAIAEVIVERANTLVSKDAKICVLNDLSLEMYLTLLKTGYKRENIYIAVGNWTEVKGKAVPDTGRNTTLLFHHHVSTSFVEDINIISLEEFLTMTFDLIIANPPYGKIGAQITKRITDDVNFEEFINLLPIKDMPSAGLDACSHIDMPETIVCPPHSFGDADILTHILRITKAKNKTYASFEELVADSFIVDKPMIKFMRANTLAQHYAIDNISAFNSKSDINTDFVFHHFDTGSAHTCGLPKCDSAIPKNRWNFEMIDESVSGRLHGVDKVIHFNTAGEKLNFANFVKANRNFINRMIVNQFITIRTTTTCFPKVDWTRDDWTIEKILVEVAGYTESEITSVLTTMNEEYFVKDDASIERLFGKYLNGED